MKNDIAQLIIAKKLQCVFLSPHYDDALLSCGGLITKLNGKVAMTIVNVFTKAHKKPYTLSAWKFVKDSGYTDAETLYDDRRLEDQNAFVGLRVKTVDLGLEDALFRTKEKTTPLGRIIPEFSHLYPTYQLHVTRGGAIQDHTVKILEKYLEKYKHPNYLIFAPFGIGNHVDHRIARLACEKIFERYVLYSDFPYNVRLNKFGRPLPLGDEYQQEVDMAVKEPLIKAYKTQFTGLFKNGIIPAHKEIYFTSQKL